MAMPQSDNSADYVTQLRRAVDHAEDVMLSDPEMVHHGSLPTQPVYHIPMAKPFLDESVFYQPLWNAGLRSDFEDFANEVEWPEMRALATNAVATDFNPHPPDPRLYFSSDNAHACDVEYFRELVSPYFALMNTRVFTDISIKNLLKRSVTYRCDSISLTGAQSNVDVLFCFACNLYNMKA